MEVIYYDQREGVSVADAVAWADAQRCPVTLYLYGVGKGTRNEVHFNAVEKRFSNLCCKGRL
jgi:hypothetical protein